jgi:hypothetical protein
MKEDSNSLETTSRRQFTKAIVTAAVAAPIAASMAGCEKGPGGTSAVSTPSPGPSAVSTASTATSTTECCTVTPSAGITEISFAGALGIEDHIPPMRLDGGGSLVIDSRIKFAESGTGTGPFTYTEDGITSDDDRYGDIKGAVVISEVSTQPFVKISVYHAILPGAELLLWYQDISAMPVGDDDVTYPTVSFPDGDPDVRINGGRGANKFKLVTKKKKLVIGDKSHKPKRPHRSTQTPNGALARHFRIGQWRLVNGSTTLAEGKGDDNYTLYLRFGHFQP